MKARGIKNEVRKDTLNQTMEKYEKHSKYDQIKENYFNNRMITLFNIKFCSDKYYSCHKIQMDQGNII